MEPVNENGPSKFMLSKFGTAVHPGGRKWHAVPRGSDWGGDIVHPKHRGCIEAPGTGSGQTFEATFVCQNGDIALGAGYD